MSTNDFSFITINVKYLIFSPSDIILLFSGTNLIP